MGRGFRAADGADAVAADGQRTAGGQPGIELAQAAGSDVARVGEGRFPLFAALLVELAEGLSSM